jgi:superfamily I DNA and/or RNA helicase
VGVIALYAAQAELLRRLIERSAALAASGLSVEVGTPATFRQRECLAALVSLTRSHSHRAVTFGEGPHALALALTRAASRLQLFGDPGTLARRTQWGGPVDHLDEAAAARERALVSRLLAHLHGPAPHPPPRPREGSP